MSGGGARPRPPASRRVKMLLPIFLPGFRMPYMLANAATSK